MHKWKMLLEFTDYHGTEKEDITNCLKTLFATPVGTVATYRDFGISWDFIDQPLPIAMNMMVIELREKIEKYEKRVTVSDIECKFDEIAGTIEVKVVLEDV